MSDKVVRVLIVDDHEVVRRGIMMFLETQQGIEVVGQAENGRVAVAMANELKPDVILMDLVMPEMDGIQAIREIRSQQSESQILVLTSFGSDDKIFPAVKAGALGYLLKDTSPDELVQAILQAAEGHATLNPTVAGRLLRQFSSDTEPATPIEPLTEREIEVLQLIARGLTNEQLGKKLFISEATVRTHVSHILGKLGLGNRTQAALWALRKGIVSLDEIGTLGPSDS
jgi:NarL family two-component system response regulator LiaR